MKLTLYLAASLLLLAGARKNAKKQPTHENEDSGENSDDSIETVTGEKILDAIADDDRNMLVIFFESSSRCPQCSTVLRMLEDIDDDLEATGWIDVVKTTDKHFAKDLGVTTFPAIVYFRRRSPVYYDGDFSDAGAFIRWVRWHDGVAGQELKDDDFEERTDSASPSQGALDWFVYFYNSKDRECSQYLPLWETVAHHLRGQIHTGLLDTAESDDVAERFKIDDDCPTFILFRRGKMYKYKDLARDVKSLTSFALHRFKEQRGHRVPDPPTKLEELYEEIKEDLQEMFREEKSTLVMGGFGVLTVFLLGLVIYKLVQSRRATHEKPE